MGLYGDNYGLDYGTGEIVGTTTVSTTSTGDAGSTNGNATGTADVTTDTATSGGYGSSYGYNYGEGSGTRVTGTGEVSGGVEATTGAFSFSPVQGVVATSATALGQVTGAKPAYDMGVDWTVTRNTQHVEDDCYDVQITDTANPFGNKAVAYVDDSQGEKFSKYSRGTRVDFAYSIDGGITYQNRFSGFVVEPREIEKQGADALEVECYSFDQFLRRGKVSSDLSGLTITQALKTIVQDDTPVGWDINNVSVGDEQTLTRGYRGEKVENVLLSLRSKSSGEDFGVNSDLEFFWKPSEGSSAPRGIDNSQWFNYDIPEQGKEAINEVTVYFNDGEESVTVDDGGDKLEMQDKIGTPDPVGFSEEVKRPEITNIEDARDVGEQILNGRSATLTGEVTTYGLLGAEPGDVLPIEIVPRGIEGDYRIAELEYVWARDETTVTIVEKRGQQDDLLVRLSDSVKRVEMEGADRDGVNNTITSTGMGVEISVSGSVDTTSYTTYRYTNIGRDLLRDAWIQGSTISIAEIAVGSDGSKPSRTDTALGTELERVAVSENLEGSKSVEYSGSFDTTDIREVGLFTSSGELVARATIPETGLASPVDVTMQLTVSNDSGFENGVVTDTGQTAVRDILADNSPSVTAQYAYGSDSSSPTESDSSLGNQVIAQSLDELLAQRATSTGDWGGLVGSIPEDSPLTVTDSGELTTTHSNVVREGENPDSPSPDDVPTVSDSNFSGGEGTQHFNVNQNTIAWEVSFDHDVPADQVGIQIRDELIDDSTDADGLVWYFNGNKIDELQSIPGSKSLGWIDLSDSSFYSSGPNGYDGGGLKAGETYRLELFLADSGNGEGYHIDCVSVHDRRYNFTFDNDNGGSSGYLDGPETRPDLHDVVFNTATTRRKVENATAELNIDDTSNQQYIELSNDDGGTWHKTSNSSTASASFASAETDVDVRVGLSRYGSRTSATPQTGFKSQAISLYELFADVDAITSEETGACSVKAIIPPGTITGSTLREAAQLDGSGTALTRSIFADIDVSANQRVISSERTSFE